MKANKGPAGVDCEAIAVIEQQGVGAFLESIHEDLQVGKYRPKAVLRRYIPKSDGKRRPLGIPCVRDRVAQMAVKLVIEPVCEADFGQEGAEVAAALAGGRGDGERQGDGNALGHSPGWCHFPSSLERLPS